MKTLLKGGCILTLDRRVGNFARGDLLIVDGRVAEIGENLRARDAEVVDCSDTIVMPGFVDTHRHGWRTLFRNAGTDAAGRQLPVSQYREHHQPDDVYAATLISLLGAIVSGTTTVVDWADVPPTDAHIEASLQAHTDAGVRTVYVHPADQAVDVQSVSQRAAGLDRTSVAVGVDEPTAGSIERVASQMVAARSIGLRIHAHAGSEASRGAIAELHANSLLGADLTLVHCTHLDGPDLDAVASTGTAVSLTPSTEMAGGLGSPPMQEFIDRDIAPGLGVDDEALAPGDIFAQMRAAISIQHATSFDLKLAGKAGIPKLMTTREVIRFATVDGGRTAGLAGVGSLTPGAQADVTVLRTDRPNIYPINDPIGAVVWGMDTSNLDWVFVGGRSLVRNGEPVADLERARALAIAAQQRVAGAAGLLAGIEPGGGE
jgi:cytosine/adenosine deaminase-related metal-dependent hydrolase